MVNKTYGPDVKEEIDKPEYQGFSESNTGLTKLYKS